LQSLTKIVNAIIRLSKQYLYACERVSLNSVYIIAIYLANKSKLFLQGALLLTKLGENLSLIFIRVEYSLKIRIDNKLVRLSYRLFV
jgi:hypothetical protein